MQDRNEFASLAGFIRDPYQTQFYSRFIFSDVDSGVSGDTCKFSTEISMLIRHNPGADIFQGNLTRPHEWQFR